jgi:hypothetical protein
LTWTLDRVILLSNYFGRGICFNASFKHSNYWNISVGYTLCSEYLTWNEICMYSVREQCPICIEGGAFGKYWFLRNLHHDIRLLSAYICFNMLLELVMILFFSNLVTFVPLPSLLHAYCRNKRSDQTQKATAPTNADITWPVRRLRAVEAFISSSWRGWDSLREGSGWKTGEFVVCKSVLRVRVSCANLFKSIFFVRLYRFKCFDRLSVGLANKFCVSRSCDYCNNLFSKLTSFIIILVENEINAQKGPSEKLWTVFAWQLVWAFIMYCSLARKLETCVP